MSYQPKSESLRRWSIFRDQHRALIDGSGLPEAYVEKQTMFMDFLMHGYIDHHLDTRRFTVGDMSHVEHQAFESLVREYFRSGFGYFTPVVFRSERLIQDFELEFGGAHTE